MREKPALEGAGGARRSRRPHPVRNPGPPPRHGDSWVAAPNPRSVHEEEGGRAPAWIGRWGRFPAAAHFLAFVLRIRIQRLGNKAGH